jgi:predicted nucleic acid-binding protein
VTSELLDTTIVIDHLNGIPEATRTIDAMEDPSISVITWIEVVAGLRDAESESVGRRFIATLQLVQLSPAIAEETVCVRQERRLKLPDAIILATARHLGCPLVTRNTKDFPEDDPDVRIPYRL